MKSQRGSLSDDSARNDNSRVKRYIAKYTINPQSLTVSAMKLVRSKQANGLTWFFGTGLFWCETGTDLERRDDRPRVNGRSKRFYSARTTSALSEMFAARGKALTRSCLSFVSGSAHEANIADRYGLEKTLVPVHGIRKLRKSDMIHNSWQPKVTVDPETYEVFADGELLVCEPASVLPWHNDIFSFKGYCYAPFREGFSRIRRDLITDFDFALRSAGKPGSSCGSMMAKRLGCY